MKNFIPIVLFLALAAQAFAQIHPHHSQALKQYHSLLGKAIGHDADLPAVDSTEFLPPFNQQTYHLTDSIYYYYYDSSVWDLTSKRYLENDCNLGQRLVSTLYTDFQDIDSFELSERDEMEYYPDGGLKLRKHLEYFNNGWITTGYDYYSEDEHPTESWHKTYDPVNDLFTDGTRATSTYEGQQYPTVILNYNWDMLSQTWMPTERFTNTFTNDLITQDLYEAYNAGTWELAVKNEYDYFPNNQYKEIRLYIYVGGVWEDVARYTCTLDGNGDTVLELTAYIDSSSGQFLPTYRQLNTYVSHRPIEQLGESYNNGDWIKSSKNTFSYHLNGNKHEASVSEWNEVGQLWVETYYQKFNEDGKILLRESHIGYDPVTNTYYGASRFIYTYNAAGSILEAKVEHLEHNTLDTYLPNTITNYEYDNDGAFLESIHQYWSFEDSVFELDRKTHSYNTGCAFSATTTPQEENKGCQFANPIHPGQAIQCTGLKEGAASILELYDLAGRLVHEQAFSPISSFDPIRPLPTGLYLLYIYDDMGWRYRSKVLVLD